MSLVIEYYISSLSFRGKIGPEVKIGRIPLKIVKIFFWFYSLLEDLSKFRWNIRSLDVLTIRSNSFALLICSYYTDIDTIILVLVILCIGGNMYITWLITFLCTKNRSAQYWLQGCTSKAKLLMKLALDVDIRIQDFIKHFVPKPLVCGYLEETGNTSWLSWG